MLKRILKIVAVLIGLPIVVIVADAVLGPKSPFGGTLEIKLSHLIMGGPQSKAVDFDDALALFDDTCMVATVFKVPPYSVDEQFTAAGLVDEGSGRFVLPSRPLSATAFQRPDDAGLECFISFTSFEDIETVIRPGFEAFTMTRLDRPMTDDPDAFQFAYPPLPEGVQSDRPAEPDPAIIRSFADSDGMRYFVILRPDAYSLTHILQLIVLPETAVGAAG